MVQFVCGREVTVDPTNGILGPMALPGALAVTGVLVMVYGAEYRLRDWRLMLIGAVLLVIGVIWCVAVLWSEFGGVVGQAITFPS